MHVLLKQGCKCNQVEESPFDNFIINEQKNELKTMIADIIITPG